MYLFIVITCLIVNIKCEGAISKDDSIKKCCGFGEYLNITDWNTFHCVEDTRKRLGIHTNYSNFLIDHNSGSCLDITPDGFFRYEFENGRISEEIAIGERAFPKCCPLGYTYSTKIHACQENITITEDYIKETFVQVGLPQCKLIVDENIQGVSPDLNPDDKNYCIDQDQNGDLVKRNCKENLKGVCDKIRCVKKCCPDGKSYVNGPNCVDTHVHGLDLTFSDNIVYPLESYAVISNKSCKRIYLMDPKRYIYDLDRNGTFRYWKNRSNSYIYEPVDHPNSYCIEHHTRQGVQGYYFFMCFKDTQLEEKFEYTLWPKILSCIFLALTIAIYLLLGETRNIFGKILINYCIGTLLLFSLLVYAQVDLEPTDKDCKLIGYSLIFLSSVSFAWLNVMCWDIWFTFGCTKQSVGAHQRRRDIKRLCFYMLYGYGLPVLLTLNVHLFASLTVLHSSIQPYVGLSVCFIEPRDGNYASIVFLRLPHFIMQCANIYLFFKTINYCLKVKKEINKINDTTRHERKNSFKKDKERLFLILKLSVIMGFTFIFETTSGFVTMREMGVVPKYIEIIWDCINCLQGVFIFIIFICKKKTYNTILRKLNLSKTGLNKNQSTITSTTGTNIYNARPKNGKTF